MRQLLPLAISLLPLSAVAGDQLGAPAWETEGLRTPESVLLWHSPQGKQLLVSEIEGDSTEADGQGGIALLSLDGEIVDQNFVRGLDAPKGMAVVENTLYVADITQLRAIDLQKGELKASYPVEGAVFLNDVAANDAGQVFVSDTRTGKVHRLLDGQMELYLEEIDNANGLTFDGDSLLIGAGDTLYQVSDGEPQVVAQGFAEKADGVEPLADGGYLVSCWAGLIYRVSEDGAITQLRDTRDPQVNTADIGYDPDTHIVYVPTFYSDSVQAFTL
ncbi:GTP-binding protein [Gilvimarinus xylanilyticus]|uniref:GTP-binding protein n=1 Tax=Gilvimarinus xylanilyticus TaxID=2944139 RepID=A0A9X2KTM1_9GAMM|nr:GTP-binding protein [Gilvimarinus xylanilyticus]MCP8899337.1 GTP-binding protein [Gilvimarinus xylanilyticus]